MNKGFRKFQSRYYLEIAIKVILASLVIPLLCAGTFIILDKFSIISLEMWIYIVIPVALFIISAGIGWLIFKPNMKKTSIRIDKELGLNQKVETMVEFIDKSDNDIVNYQRNETFSILDRSPTKAFKLHIGLIFIIPIVLSSLFFTGTTIVPKKKNANSQITEKVLSEKSLRYIDSINNIKKMISQSSLKKETVDDFIEKLDLLIESIKSDGSDEYTVYVIKTINDTKEVLDKYNTCNDIYDVFSSSNNNTFVSLGTNIKLLSLEDVKQDLSYIAKSLEGLNTSSLVKYTINELYRLKNHNIDENEELYKSLISIADKLSEIEVSDSIDSTLKINEAFDSSLQELRVGILTQRLNVNMNSYIISELRRIFELPDDSDGNENTDAPENKEELDSSNNSSDEDNKDDDKDEEKDNQGGAGTGESLYGSDDHMFDPEKGDIEYGEAIDEYFANLFSLINEEEDEEKKQKLLELFDAYYNILYGNEQNEEEN